MRIEAPGNLPNAELAARLAARVEGRVPIAVTRFTTGARHYVYDVRFSEHRSVVVRIGDRTAHAEMEGAVHLSRLLKPLGVPLPTLLAEDVEAELPWLVLERLAGTDLGAVIASLSDGQLDLIAAGVAAAQGIVAKIGSAGRYGYAARPEHAPFAAWSDVLMASFERSKKRLAAAGLFDATPADSLEKLLIAARRQLDRIGATAFLHDTTTKNVIIGPGGTLSGIVDVDDLCFGDSRYPAALTSAVLLAHGGPLHYVAAWLRHAGKADDPTFRLYVALFLFDLMAEHGQVFNGNQTPSTPEARAGLLLAFEDSLRLAAGS